GGDVVRFRAAGVTGIAAATLRRPGMAPAPGGILLLIPGFLTSVLGLAVLFPVSRRWLWAGCRQLFAAGQRSADPRTIDLAPGEWRPLPGPRLPPANGPSKG